MNNKKIIFKSALAFAFCSIAAGLASCGTKHTVSGNINGLGDDTLYVVTIDVNADRDQEAIVDTIIADNGKFSYDTLLESPSYIMIEPASMRMMLDDGRRVHSTAKIIFLMLKPGEKITVKGKIDDGYIEYVASGSDFNRDISMARNSYKDADLAIDSLHMTFYTDNDVTDTKQRERTQKLMHERTQFYFQARDAKLDYAKANLDKELAAYYLLQQPNEVFGEFYPQLSDKVRNGVFAEKLIAQNDKYENHMAMKNSTAHIKEGNVAPNFTLKNVNGEEISLRDIKDKYIVIDFWGSWCSWCIKGFPDMKAYYEKYKGKVEFVGVACSDNMENWKKAISDNGLKWVQLKDTDSNETAKSYGVQGFPTKMILDKDYRFVYIKTGENRAFYEKLDELLQ